MIFERRNVVLAYKLKNELPAGTNGSKKAH